MRQGEKVERTKEELKKMTLGITDNLYFLCYLFIIFKFSTTLTQRAVRNQGRAGRTLEER